MAVANVQDAIMLLGDSITEFGFTSGGFATRLAGERALVTLLCRAEMCDIDPHASGNNTEAYVRKMDVINRGFGGYNTDLIIPVFEQVGISSCASLILDIVPTILSPWSWYSSALCHNKTSRMHPKSAS